MESFEKTRQELVNKAIDQVIEEVERLVEENNIIPTKGFLTIFLPDDQEIPACLLTLNDLDTAAMFLRKKLKGFPKDEIFVCDVQREGDRISIVIA